KRHATLRACFMYQGLNRPVQVIAKEVDVPWEEKDLTGCRSEDQKRQLTEWLKADRVKRFDLDRPPLLRFTLVRLGAEQYQLVITNHHILLDGWSMPILIDELVALYGRRGVASGLPKVTPYKEYLACLAMQNVDEAKEAWQRELAGLQEGT